jgi:hypothetical protein
MSDSAPALSGPQGMDMQKICARVVSSEVDPISQLPRFIACQDFDTESEAQRWLQSQGVGYRGYTPFRVGQTFVVDAA